MDELDLLAQKYADQVSSFKLFCEKFVDSFDDQDWYALSIGYFIALGIDNEEDARNLSTYVRYRCNYWC